MIFPANAHVLSGRALDPTGRVYLHEGEIFRAIYPAAAPRVREMFRSGLVAQLVERRLLIPSELTERDGQLTLHHERVPFAVGGHEWPAACLHDAALAWLELNLILAEHGMGTVDAHSANFGQTRDSAPVWLDFGSIAPLRDVTDGIGEFTRHYANPLRLLSRSSPLRPVVRTLLRHGGISDYEWLSLRWSALGPLGGKVQTLADTLRRRWVRTFPRQKTASPEARIALLKKLRAQTERCEPVRAKSYWTDYHGSKGDDAIAWKPDDARHAELSRQISALRPKQLIDLAGNIGRFALHAESLGAEVLALDFDEGALDELYATVRRQNRNRRISCGWANVMQPPFERHGITRRADTVLALALTHHLALGQHFPWKMIAAALAQHCSENLLVEFMPNGLSADGPPKTPLPDWYRRDAMLEALGVHFTDVKVVAEFREASPRDLILARGKKSHA